MVITEEMIIGGFVSKIINDIVDIPENLIKDAIRNADKKKRDENQSIETRIYQATIDAIKEFTKRGYKGQDVLYDAAESIIRGFKNSNNNVEAVRVGLKMLVSQVTSETCEDFLKTLQQEICMDENDILYKEILLLQEEEILENIHEGFDVSNRNDEETHRKLDYLIEKKNGKEIHAANYSVKSPIVNRADEYAKRWDKNVFLNDFNKRDKNAGVNIKLREIYLEEHLPYYEWKTDGEPSTDLKKILREYILDNHEKKMLLILGHPGIGKSTLITWMMANIVEKEENILVYQFASDLGSVDWQSNNLLDEIFSTIGLKYNELEGKSLILDGFDEIYIKGDRERILHKLNQELKKKNYLEKFSLVITCRENYVNRVELKGIEHITLQAWGEEQIRSFCETYEEVIKSKDLELIVNRNSEVKISKIIEKKDIMGIPLILYMVLALNINIDKSSSIVDIYDQIFSVKRGGIYDRCYDIEHRINEPEIKKFIHQISQKIAFWIFENNANKAFIPHEMFEEICDNEINRSKKSAKNIQRDVLIGNYFKPINHCDGVGTKELQFIHRSIYEYFVAIYFFESIYELQLKEDAAGKLGELLKDGHLSEQILEFIKYKFDKLTKYNLNEIIKGIFQIMIRDGMTFYTKERYTDILNREMNIFFNMLEILHSWKIDLGEFEYKNISYLQFNRKEGLYLKGLRLMCANLNRVCLYKARLERVNLERANLEGANLEKARLENVNLKGANLKDVNLKGANLTRVKLERVNLKRVNLEGANLRDINLEGANLKKANLKDTSLEDVNLKNIYLGGADLEGANFEVANLEGANLRKADLKKANLSGALLNKVDLRRANLEKTIFDEKQVDLLYQKYNLNDCRVFCCETGEIIGYREYCVNKQKKDK